MSLRGAARPWAPEYRRSRVLMVDDDVVLGWAEMTDEAPTPARLEPLLASKRNSSPRRRRGRPGKGADATMTVVVCTRDRPEALARCLARLQEAVSADRSGVPARILVVDNAPSDDATAAVVAAAGGAHPVERVVAAQPGLSRARNVGLWAAETEMVVFTDDDVLVDRDWLRGVRRGFARHPDVALVTGLVAAAELDTPVQARFDQQVRWSDRLQPARWAIDPDGAPREASFPYAAGQFGTGASMAVRRRVALDLGGFDEHLGAGTRCRGGEDLEMFVRVLRAGYQIAYEPGAIAWHVHRRDDEAFRRQVFAYGTGLAAYVTALLMQPGRRHLARGASAAAFELRRHRRQEPRSIGGVAPKRLELAGLAWGAPAYLLERWSGRSTASTLATRVRAHAPTAPRPVAGRPAKEVEA